MGKSCDGGGLRFEFRLETLTHQGFDLRPQAGIALALHVAAREVPLEPCRSGAPDWRFPVIETIVAENLGLRIVGGGDAFATVEKAVGLVEIDSGHDIFGDDAIVLPGLGDAVDLDGEEHGDSGAVQFASQHDDGGRSPTMAKEDDARLRFFRAA